MLLSCRESRVAAGIGAVVERCMKDSKAVDTEALCIIANSLVWTLHSHRSFFQAPYLSHSVKLSIGTHTMQSLKKVPIAEVLGRLVFLSRETADWGSDG